MDRPGVFQLPIGEPGGHGGEANNPMLAEVVRYSVYTNGIYCFLSFPPQRLRERRLLN